MFENTRVSEAFRVSLSIGQTFGHLYIEYVLENIYIQASIDSTCHFLHSSGKA